MNAEDPARAPTETAAAEIGSQPAIVEPPLIPADAPPPTSTQTPTPLAAGLHPLSLVFELAHRIRTNLIPAIFASFSAATGGVIGLYIGLGIFGIAIAIAVVRFLTFRYRLTDEHLLVDQGLVFRTHRSVPIDRIQNIDSVQNLFHRFFQVAEVRIETASGNEPEAVMRVISMTEVERLRTKLNTVQQQSSAAAPQPSFVTQPATDSPSEETASTAAPLAPGPALEPISETILTIPVPQLIKAGLISNRGQVLAGIVVGYFWQAWVRGPRMADTDKPSSNLKPWVEALFRRWAESTDFISWISGQVLTIAIVLAFVVLILLALRLFSVAWFILKFYDYQLVRRGRDFQIQCGLFTKVSATIPGHRIQVINVRRTWLARCLGLAAIRVEASGGAGNENEDASTTVARQWFVPVLAEGDVSRVLNALQPGIRTDHHNLDWQPVAPRAYQRMIRIPLLACGLLIAVSIGLGWFLNWGFTGPLACVALLAATASVISARRRARSRRFAHTELGFIYRSGLLVQKTSYGFWDRTQTVHLTQSPFDRRWGMARLLFDTAGAGTADHQLQIEYLDLQVAQREYAHACQQLA